jgi:hypothetical protein
MKIAITLFLTLIIIILASTCYYDSQEFLFPQISNQCDSTGTIPFASVDSVLKANCFSCHDGPSASSGLDLNGYDKVYPYATTIRSGTHNPILQGAIRRMPGFQPMPQPPAPSLDICGIRIIELWIEQGALPPQ